jgi:predicted DNA-binding protein with PD1-like motif
MRSSLVGTVGESEAHLWDGCLVYTTAEIVLPELPGLLFRREPDPATGFREREITTS